MKMRKRQNKKPAQTSHDAPGKALGFRVYCSKHRKIRKAKQKQEQLLLSKGDWYDVFSLPIAKSVVGSWEDPLADVEVVVVVLYSMDSTLADAERKLAGALAAYHLLTLDGEASTRLVKLDRKIMEMT